MMTVACAATRVVVRVRSVNVGVGMINGQSYIQPFRPGLVYESGKGFRVF